MTFQIFLLAFMFVPPLYLPLLFEFLAHQGVKLVTYAILLYILSSVPIPSNSSPPICVPCPFYIHLATVVESPENPSPTSQSASLSSDFESEQTEDEDPDPIYEEPMDRIYYTFKDIEPGDILFPMTADEHGNTEVLTAYKRVGQKVKPISQAYPEWARTRRTMPEDPLATLPPLSPNIPDFKPSAKISRERMDSLEINNGFLLPEEVKLFEHIMCLNEDALAFVETDRGTLKETYFSPYIYPVVDHVPWEFKNIPIPPGIVDKVIELLKVKISHGVYEASQSSYRSRWFCVLKKNGSLRLVHNLQPLNKVSV